MGAELFHADGRTDMTKLLVAFRNFANASKNRPPGWGLTWGFDTLEVDKYNRNLNVFKTVIHLHCLLDGKNQKTLIN